MHILRHELKTPSFSNNKHQKYTLIDPMIIGILYVRIGTPTNHYLCKKKMKVRLDNLAKALQQPKEEGVLKWKRFGELINLGLAKNVPKKR